MSKQCRECLSVTNNEALRCDACGAQSWRSVPNRMPSWGWLILLVVVGFLVFLYWLLIWRFQPPS
jgi:hypothetical protein